MSVREDQCVRSGDASLYVFGELSGRQQESFARHIRHCEECAQEVELLTQADAAPLLGTAHLPPAEEEDPGRRAPTPTLTVAAANARAARLAAEKAAAEGKRRPPIDPPVRPVLRPIEGGAGAPPARRSWFSGRRLLKTPMPRSAMVSFVALGVLAIATVAMTSRIANVHYYRIRAGWSKGGAALKLTGNQLELLLEDMPRAATGTGYEVWVRNRGSKRLRATGAWLHLNQLRQGGVNVPGNFHNWAVIAVYVEPLVGKGSTRSGAVVVGDLRSL
ncbi:MAG TPA: zf-HC2 domain-containing protein [Solirubrobacteraceae bacterium]|jgi:hypothetical protein|nr:zf-HC2 domain-containing protein [Solirubrobacteraceae bacterium]